ncbi:GRF zinc finger protein [Medicago truncatula]|uniref:GRF zinc finger protein n=2 Tax=Medicago truncatula TaxID=3880 RepID=A0A072TS47_MEDTR|nr:GRF zinc finger protein [Medicago truncatula]
MGQSIGSVGSSLRRRTVAQCRCGEETVIRTITDNTNPNCGRRFWGCRNYKNQFDKGCSFFKLLDEEVTDERDLLISKLQKKNVKLKNRLERTRLWLKISLIFGFGCFVVCLVLGTVLACKCSVSLNQMYLK